MSFGSYGKAEMTTYRMHALARDACCIGDEMEKVLLHRAENPASLCGIEQHASLCGIEQQPEINYYREEMKRKPPMGG